MQVTCETCGGLGELDKHTLTQNGDHCEWRFCPDCEGVGEVDVDIKFAWDDLEWDDTDGDAMWACEELDCELQVWGSRGPGWSMLLLWGDNPTQNRIDGHNLTMDGVVAKVNEWIEKG